MAEKLLTDRKAQTAKPKAKPYRLADGGNLYLFVSNTGVKSWQFRYRYNGVPKTLTLGKYPKVSLETARAKADTARTDADAGHDLTQKKRTDLLAKIAKNAASFEAVSQDWLIDEARRQHWSADYREEVTASLQRHLSALGPLPIATVNAPLVSPILRRIERSTPAMLEKIHRRLLSIMDYSVEQGLIAVNPLPRRRARVTKNHYPAITDLADIGEVLRQARAADPSKGVMRAHVLLAFTAMRVSEVVGAPWTEFDLTAGNWTIPRARMKRKDKERRPHVVPLPPELLRFLKEWKIADGEGAAFVCAAPRDADTHITPEAIEKFYRRTLDLVGKHSPHSWRSAFSTICREAGKSGEVIESQLDHIVGNKIESAYDRSQRLELRRELMKWYETQLITARDGAQVVALRGRGSTAA